MVPILAGLSGRGVKPLTWASCIVALLGVGLLEQGGAPPGVGDVWNLLSALFFGLQVCCAALYQAAPSICTCYPWSGLLTPSNQCASVLCVSNTTNTVCANSSRFGTQLDLAGAPQKVYACVLFASCTNGRLHCKFNASSQRRTAVLT